MPEQNPNETELNRPPVYAPCSVCGASVIGDEMQLKHLKWHDALNRVLDHISIGTDD